MKTINQVAGRIDPTTTTEKQENIYSHDEDIWVKSWRRLLSMKLVHEPVGSSDFKYWRYEMREFTDDQLGSGCGKASNFTGFFTLGEFKDLCTPEFRAPYHKSFQALPKPKMTPEQRKAAAKKMREEVGL